MIRHWWRVLAVLWIIVCVIGTIACIWASVREIRAALYAAQFIPPGERDGLVWSAIQLLMLLIALAILGAAGLKFVRSLRR